MRGKVLQKIFPAFGTINTITLYGSFHPEIAEQIKKRVLELHGRFSFFEPGSDIFRINQQAGMKPVGRYETSMCSSGYFFYSFPCIGLWEGNTGSV